ncbi:MAG: hypothetical protein ABI367_13760 [Mucilaginibacter sp.]
MKKSSKWLTLLLATIVVALCIVIIFKVNCRWNLAPKPIPSEIIAKELVPLDTAKYHQAVFDVICDSIFKPYIKNKDKVPYGGGILRNTDVLLSLGLNNAELYDYVQCEHLRLKTMLGYDYAKNTIKMYAHPVEIQTNGTDTVVVDLVFDKSGNLYYAKNGMPWQNPCNKCLFCGALSTNKSTKPEQDIKLNLNKDGMYVIDLNNPCPPCD